MFYGVLQEEYIYEDYILQEIDLKGAVKTVIKKIKNAILSLINKIDKFLDKCKDSKVKSIMKSLLSKVKKLLGDTENIETEADAKKVKDEYQKYGEEFNKFTKNKTSKDSSEDGSFKPSRFLEETLKGTDAYAIVGAVMGYINADPYFVTDDFRTALKYTISKAKVEIIQEYDDEFEMTSDQSKWDEKYYSFQRVYLKENFCYKRIDHVEKVGKFVGRKKGFI